jgi:prevent-host-death family protein
MAHKTKKIHSLREFQQNAPEMVREIKKTGRPLLLGINGKPKFIVQDAASYERMLELIDRLECIEGIRRGLEDFEHGRSKPAKEVMEEMRRKYKIPEV